jgi:hypothetical protein
MPSTSRHGETVRQMLDYVCWMGLELQTLGAHGGGDLEAWRRRVGEAYRALVNPMVAGYGDPYPPDVPPAHSPGIWPDVAASDIPGMTIRHQLVVVRMLAEQSRAGVGVRARPELLQDLEARIARARAALDHGAAKTMPAEARTEPSPALMAQAKAEEKAIREHARRRNRQVRDMLRGHKGAPKAARAKPARKPAGGKRKPGGAGGRAARARRGGGRRGR